MFIIFVFKEMQIKKAGQYCTPIRMAKIEKTDYIKCWQR